MAESAQPDIAISGVVAERFAQVALEFEENFASRGEVGAALCVMIDGEVVIDLVGGTRDLGRERAWQHDTLVNVYSVGKSFIALCLLELIDRHSLDLDAPVAEVWPAFGAFGKADVSIRHALSHQAGVPALRGELTNIDLFDFARMADAVAMTEPWCAAGERLIYHTNTYGHLIGGIIDAVSGVLPGQCLKVLTGPLDADVVVGVPDEDLARCADVHWDLSGIPERSSILSLTGDAQMAALSYFNPPGYSSIGVVNSSPWRQSQIPSTNMHASAPGVAKIYDALLTPDRVISTPLLKEATRVQASGFCPILGEEASFGLGFTPTSARRSFGTSVSSFGHFGTGGAVGFCDPERKIAFGYVMNHVIPRWQSTRNRALIDALYEAL